MNAKSTKFGTLQGTDAELCVDSVLGVTCNYLIFRFILLETFIQLKRLHRQFIAAAITYSRVFRLDIKGLKHYN